MTADLQVSYSPVVPPSPGGPRAPDTYDISWLLLCVCFVLLLVLLAACGWLMWRMRSLVRVVQQLQSGDGNATSVPGPFGFLPRFKMRTLLAMFTFAAILLGLFAKEFARARRQGQIVERMEMTDAFDTFGSSYYELGMLGDSYVAGLMCEWVHPHFGCRLTHLSLDLETGYYAQSHPIETAVLEHVGELRDLQALRVANYHLLDENIEAIARLPKLKMLSLAGCSLPQGALDKLGGIDTLEYLDVSNCNLHDSELAALGTLNRLEFLSLAYNQLTDEATEHLAPLTQLRILSLEGTDITSASVIELVRLDQLTELNLAKTEVDTQGAEFLVELPNLRSLNLAQCHHLTGRDEPYVEDALRENHRLSIEWDEPNNESEVWDFYDNRPVGPQWRDSGSVGAFGSSSYVPAPPTSNSSSE